MITFYIIVTFCIISFLSTLQSFPVPENPKTNLPFLVVLGIAQDAGYPQAACQKSCCMYGWENPQARRHVSCLAIVDPETSQRWIIDATPDFKEQLRSLDQIFPVAESPGISGIFLTHGHIGHYTGLIYLGREAMGAKEIPVYAMPRMYHFLSNNGPWDQLVKLKNIEVKAIKNEIPIKLNDRISITPLLVPHRDEYTETVGYRIQGPSHSALFIPDIDKWEKWDTSIESLINRVDIAFLDGTFYEEGEIPERNMSDIPHPFIIESLAWFKNLDNSEKSKIHFIHLNHTNPALIPGSNAQKDVEEKGFRIAQEGKVFEL